MLELIQFSTQLWWSHAGARQLAALDMMKSMGDQWVEACVSELSGSKNTVAHDLLRSYRSSRQ